MAGGEPAAARRFFDAALAQDRSVSRRGRGYTGIGAALETALPFGLLEPSSGGSASTVSIRMVCKAPTWCA